MKFKRGDIVAENGFGDYQKYIVDVHYDTRYYDYINLVIQGFGNGINAMPAEWMDATNELLTSIFREEDEV